MNPYDPSSAGPPGGYGGPAQPYPAGPAERPPNRKRPIILIGVIAAVVIVAAAGVGGYFLLSNGAESGPEQVAQDSAKAFTDSDVAALRKLACDAGTVKEEDIKPGGGVKLKVEIAGEPKINGSNAEVPINLKVDYSQSTERDEAGIPPSLSTKGTFKLMNSDDGWCVDLTKPIRPTG